MKNIAALCATALVLANPGIVQAQTFTPAPGTYTFSGPVTVQKNLSPATSCALSLTISVSSSGVATVTAAVLSGGPICNAITFSGLPAAVSGTGTSGNPADEVSFAGVRVNIPALSATIGADACEGTLTGYWLAGSPPQIEFDTPKSDIPDANPDGNPGTSENPCKIIGTVTQDNGPPYLSVTI